MQKHNTYDPLKFTVTKTTKNDRFLVLMPTSKPISIAIATNITLRNTLDL